jgi:phosphorylase kinase alpha/beta subunit
MVKSLLVKMLSKSILKKLQLESGLFIAADCEKTGYNKAWLRDNIYETIGLEATKDIDSLKKTYRALFDLLLKHEYKIDWAIKEKPDATYKYIHARFNPFTFDEYNEPWSNKQNDAVGAFLFKVGDLFDKGIIVFKDKNDLRILQKLVDYLKSIQYWHDKDNGVWENDEEIHASSIGACIAGLRAVKGLVHVPEYLTQNGIHALNHMLPTESATKSVDLAQLSLIFPFNAVSDEQRDLILKNVEEKLVKSKGVIRYFGDPYYNNGEEAQWVMGFAWLAKIYKDMGNKEKFEFYMDKLYGCANWKGELPELFYLKLEENRLVSNENTPLGWSQAMYLIAAEG